MATKTISTFFTNTLGANLRNQQWSWGASDPTTNRVFLRVWEDQLETISGRECVQVLGSRWKGTSPGYAERKRHIAEIESGAEGFGVLLTAVDPFDKRRRIAGFDDSEILQFGGFVDEGGTLYAIVTGRVPVDDLARQRTAESTLLPDLQGILRGRAPTTTKEALAKARVGQGPFRRSVLADWSNRCCVTRSATLDAVRASHIKPWRDCSDEERLDPANGLPLVATLDALFDAGLITFKRSGELLISGRLRRAEIALLGLEGLKLARTPSERTVRYLEHHRHHVFRT